MKWNYLISIAKIRLKEGPVENFNLSESSTQSFQLFNFWNKYSFFCYHKNQTYPMSMPNLWMTQVINVSCEKNKQRTKKTSTIASQASLLFRTYLMGGVLYLTKHASFWPSQNVIKPDSIILLSPFSYLQKRKEIKL